MQQGYDLMKHGTGKINIVQVICRAQYEKRQGMGHQKTRDMLKEKRYDLLHSFIRHTLYRICRFYGGVQKAPCELLYHMGILITRSASPRQQKQYAVAIEVFHRKQERNMNDIVQPVFYAVKKQNCIQSEIIWRVLIMQ